MAILGQFEAYVEIDGVRAEEYDDEDEEPSGPDEIAKFVEAKSGAFFSVRCLVDSRHQFEHENGLDIDVNIDGDKHAIGKLLMKSEFLQEQGPGAKVGVNVAGRRSYDATGATLYRFQFADLEIRDLTSQDDSSTFREKYGDLGTILVRAYRSEVLFEIPGFTSTQTDLQAVPEKALKGRSLDVATQMTPTYGVPRGRCYQTKKIGKPVATFKFKYRTRRALQAEMIIDRSPSPVPLEKRPEEELTREEMVELLRRQREQLNEQPVVVKEEKKHKRERSCTTLTPMRPLKSTKGNAGETIYHLDSDNDEEQELGDQDSDVEELPKTKRTEVEVIELL